MLIKMLIFIKVLYLCFIKINEGFDTKTKRYEKVNRKQIEKLSK